MTPERWQQIKQLFQEARELAPQLRSGFLDERCHDDDELRSEVISLLEADQQPDQLIDRPAYAAAAQMIHSTELTELNVAEAGQIAGQAIGQYEVIKQLGCGGMGEVYLARDTRLDRPVAIKILPPSFTHDPERVRRFQQEARAVSSLNHPNIVTIHDVAESDGLRFIVSEYVQGKTLRELITGLALDQALDIAIQTGSALAAAHQAGVIHRDIKPENIMVRPDGYVKVLDFGLAKRIERTQSRPGDSQAEAAANLSDLTTRTGVVIGTVKYMSPEQARGEKVDRRSDIFSLGVVLYELITGHAPFEGKTPSHTIVAILEQHPPPLAGYAPHAPIELQELIVRALNKDRRNRYQRTDEMLAELQEIRQDLQARARQGAYSAGGSKQSAMTGPAGGDSTAPENERPAGISRITLSRNKQRRLWAILTFAALLVAAAISYFSFTRTRAAIDSMAVLPLVNESADPDMEYLSDGITENIINSLSRLPKLAVMARSSVFRYKGREVDPKTVGKELGVRAVLMGRAVPRGDNLTISVELVDASNNHQIWGEQYNRKLADLLALQSEISQIITEKLRLRLTGDEQQLVVKQGTESTEAYQLYLKGRFYVNKYTEEGTVKGIDFLNRAIEIDPNYALPYVGLCDAYISLSGWTMPPLQAMPKAKEAATKAITLDGSLAEAHASLASVLFHFEFRWLEADREFKRAIELNPNSPLVHLDYSLYLTAVERFDEALAEIRRAQSLDPLWLFANAQIGWTLSMARRYDDAIDNLQKTIDLDPTFTRAHITLGFVYHHTGRLPDAVLELEKARQGEDSPENASYVGYIYGAAGRTVEAAKIIDELKELAKHRYVSPDLVAGVYAGMGEIDQSLTWLETAMDQRFDAAFMMKLDYRWDSLRSEPRFGDLVRRIGLAP